MVTYCTTTKMINPQAGVDYAAPQPKASAADKAAGSVEFKSDGTTIHRTATRTPTVDERARVHSEIAASTSGPSSAPLRLRATNGAALSIDQAEAHPSRVRLSILGRETSLKAAVSAGWVTKGADGNYYDARVGGGVLPGKSVEAVAPWETEDTSEDQHEASQEDDLPEGFELDDAQRETMAKLGTVLDENPAAIDYAFTHAANSGDMSDEGFVVTLTQRMGAERSEVESLVADAQSTYIAAADAAVAEVSNVEPALVYDWLRDQHPEAAAGVIMAAQAGSFAAVRAATGDYLNQLDTIDPEAALGADLGPHAKAERFNGKIGVRINGKLYSWREAMRFRVKT